MVIQEKVANEIAEEYLLNVVRKELGRQNDILIGCTYYEGLGWIYRHERAKDLMGGNPGQIAVDGLTGKIVEYKSSHELAKKMQEVCARAEYYRKNGYF